MKNVLLIVAVAMAVNATSVGAQEPAKQKQARLTAVERTKPKADRLADDKALAGLLSTFVKAFNAGDAKAAAATYTETAIVVDEEGKRTIGREAIEALYTASFAAQPGSKISIVVESLRFLGDQTAFEEGRATITPAGKGAVPETSRFTAVYVKDAGKWLQAAVRDELASEPTPHDRLKDLEWLVGEWVNESDAAVVITTCKWSKDGNFLDREFTMKTKGEPVLSGTQKIGWDPLKQQFKTWIFDSEGGHGEGYWTQSGNRWLIKIEGVGREGKPISATNIITRLGKDRFGWQSVDRTVAGVAIDGLDEFVVVRTPPPVGKE